MYSRHFCYSGLSLRVYTYEGPGYKGRLQRVYCAQKGPIFFFNRHVFPASPIFTKFRTKFYHDLADNVVFSVSFYDSYFFLFLYWLSSWLPNPSKWNSCCFYSCNLISANKISCQNQLVLRPKYSLTKTTKLYHFFWEMNEWKNIRNTLIMLS